MLPLDRLLCYVLANLGLPVRLFFYCFQTTLVCFYNIDKKIVSSSRIYHSYVFILFKSSIFFFMPQRGWRGMLLLGCSSVRPLVTLFFMHSITLEP